MGISVIIVNWNAGIQLFNCLDSISKFGDGLVDEIIVVDNGSSDGSEAYISEFPATKLISAGRNLGFGKACNLGARESKSDYLLFLNPDAAIYSSTLRNVHSFMESPSNKSIGICGVQLVDGNNEISRSCSRFPTPMNMLLHSIGADRILPTLGYTMSEWSHNETRIVDHVIGAFYFVRRSLFESINGFDEAFFVYLEDLDFSLRAREEGFCSVFLADARAFHVGGGTSEQVKAARLFYSLQSRIVYSFKHYNTINLICVSFATLFIEPVVRVLFSSFSLKSIGEICRAYVFLYRWFFIRFANHVKKKYILNLPGSAR